MDLMAIRRGLMAQMAGGNLPAWIAEINKGSFHAESNITSTKTLTHGCSAMPDIIVMWSDYRTYYNADKHPSNTTVVAAHWDNKGKSKSYASVPVLYAGTNDASAGAETQVSNNTSDGYIANVNATTFDILCVSNRRLDAGLTYEWIAIRLS